MNLTRRIYRKEKGPEYSKTRLEGRMPFGTIKYFLTSLGRHIAIYCYRKLNMLPDLRATFTQTKV
jgi:hypothetical protein